MSAAQSGGDNPARGPEALRQRLGESSSRAPQVKRLLRSWQHVITRPALRVPLLPVTSSGIPNPAHAVSPKTFACDLSICSIRRSVAAPSANSKFWTAPDYCPCSSLSGRSAASFRAYLLTRSGLARQRNHFVHPQIGDDVPVMLRVVRCIPDQRVQLRVIVAEDFRHSLSRSIRQHVRFAAVLGRCLDRCNKICFRRLRLLDIAFARRLVVKDGRTADVLRAGDVPDKLAERPNFRRVGLNA